MRYRHVGCDAAIRRGVGKDFADSTFHVGTKSGAEVGIVGKAGIVRRLHEAVDEAIPQVVVGSLAGMDVEHRRVAAEGRRVAWGTPEHFGPVIGQPLAVPSVPAVGEGMM